MVSLEGLVGGREGERWTGDCSQQAKAVSGLSTS